MPPRVNLEKCNGCEGREESFCEEVCPGNLMTVGDETMKAFCRNNRDCWDCMSCVKACPRNAIETRVTYQLGYCNATLKPFMAKNSITWKCTDIYGNVKTYSYKNRLEV